MVKFSNERIKSKLKGVFLLGNVFVICSVVYEDEINK